MSAQIVVTATRDSLMKAEAPTGNFGSNAFCDHEVTYLGGDKSGWWRAIADFDLSAIPAGSTVVAASLIRHVFALNNGGQGGRISRCTRPGQWVESEVTWNNYKSGSAWSAAGGDFDDTGPPANVDYTEPSSTGDHTVTGLSALVQDAIDNRGGTLSIITRLVDEDPEVDTRYRWRSKEHGSGIWRVVVDYVPPVSVAVRRRPLNALLGR
jgi:hypothetical protein